MKPAKDHQCKCWWREPDENRICKKKPACGDRVHIAVPIFEKEITECDLIVSAIEKQIPKEVTHYGKESKITRYACPNCGRMFWEKEHIGNYCDNCGQAIKYV